MKVGVISLGCAKNRVDTEQMLFLLQQGGYALTDHPEHADVLIVNTCGFIESAKQESIDTIFELASYKKTGVCQLLCVTGCLAQRYGDALASDIPEVDVITGVSRYATLPDVIRQAIQGRRVVDTSRSRLLVGCSRVLTTPPYTAYVRIAEGCDNCCAYCAIPLIRGGFVSFPMDSILREIASLASGGVREHILIAQDTSRYGHDTKSGSLASLVREAAAIPGVEWLRVLYCYPDETDAALIDEMAAHPNVCQYLDLPLQHASPGILRRMNRRGDIDSAARLLRYARAKGFTLRTTFIVGFPGETEADFDALMAFASDIKFDRMGAFSFSPEEGTPAYTMAGQVPDKVKKARLDKLMTLQAGISLERNRLRIGQTEKVLITGVQGKRYLARSSAEAPDVDGTISLSGPPGLQPGIFVSARITGADTYDLSGEILP
ncbi:MAG: 30S ribosomal protein S12 methylthiotransferase RimO [Christensenellales bacterium]